MYIKWCLFSFFFYQCCQFRILFERKITGSPLDYTMTTESPDRKGTGTSVKGFSFPSSPTFETHLSFDILISYQLKIKFRKSQLNVSKNTIKTHHKLFSREDIVHKVFSSTFVSCKIIKPNPFVVMYILIT